MEKTKDRDLDVTTASMDKLALNNLIVSLRKVAKQVKVRTIFKLTKKLKALRKQTGDEKKVARNNRKGDKFLEEVMAAKKIQVDDISKLALQNETKFEDYAREDSHSIADKAIMRMAVHKMIVDQVKIWRNQHSDWKELAAFLQTNITRRTKKTKTKDKPKKKSNAKGKAKDKTPSEVVIHEKSNKEEENSSQEDIPRKKLKAKKSVSDSKAQQNKTKQKPYSVAENKLNSDSKATTLKTKQKPGLVADNKVNFDSTVKMHKAKQKSSAIKDNKVTTVTFPNTISDSSDSESSENEHTPVVPSANKLRKNKTPVYFQRGVKVVKQLNLEDLDDDIDIIPLGTGIANIEEEEEMIPSILMEDGVRIRTTGDSFFLGEEDSSSDSEIDIVKEVKNKSDRRFVISEAEKNKGPKRTMDSRSLFVGSLSQNKKSKFKKENSGKGPYDSNRFTEKKQFTNQPAKGQGQSRDFSGKQKRDWNKQSNRFQGDNKSYKGPNKQGKLVKEGQSKAAQHHQHVTHSKGRNDGFKGKMEKKPWSKGTSQGSGPGNADATSHEVLHPSWEASKKRQQEQGAIQAFTGKKIVFDD